MNANKYPFVSVSSVYEFPYLPLATSNLHHA